MPESPHSAAMFHEFRDHWWNPDFADLLGRRFELGRVRTLLDVGCGVGHWAAVLAPRLAPGARIVGIDREHPWLVRYRRPGAGAVGADAARLPFADGSFDAASCQTLLMHVPDPELVVREMVRVVKPGGLVLAAEPNNLIGSIEFSEASASRPLSEIVLVFEYWATCIRGKRELGMGDETLGESLPGIFDRAGLRDVKLYVNDRPTPRQPPYDRPAEKAYLATERMWKAESLGPWERDALRRRFLAGGGTPARFDEAWAVLERWWDEDERARAAGTYRTAGGSLFYVAGGRKPG